MKDADEISAIAARLDQIEDRMAKIEAVLVGDVSAVRTEPNPEPAQVPERLRRISKRLSAARARAGKQVGDGKGQLTREAKIEAQRELRSVMLEYVRLEDELGNTDGDDSAP